MWSSVAAETAQASEKTKTATEKVADLNAALLTCVGEENHKSLLKLCGRLQRNEVHVEEFNTTALELFKSGEGEPMTMYRRLVLSLPNGDKRAHLVSLCDEAVMTEKANLASKNSTSSSSVPAASADSAAAASKAVPTSAAAEVQPASSAGAAAGAETPKPTATPPNEGGDRKAEEPEAAPSKSAAAVIDETKAAVESKEKAILSVMARRQADLAKEKRALDMIRAEMAAVAQQQSLEIQDVMTKLGETDRDLWYVERDFKASEIEYLRCKTRYDKMKEVKVGLANSLTSLTLNAEKKKEEKLNSIMEKLRNDGVVFPGAALATLTDP